MANHPLLCRNNYSKQQLRNIATLLIENDFDNIYTETEEAARRRGSRQPKSEAESIAELLEDLMLYSDYEIHQLCEDNLPLLKAYPLSEGTTNN